MEEKVGFFKRVKMSITNFDSYQKFATEKTGTAIKYFFQIVIIFSILASIAIIYSFSNVLNNGVEYIKNDMPDFSFEDNILTLESEEPIELEGKEVSSLLIMDTNIDTDDAQSYLDKMNNYDNSILFLKDRLIVKPNATSGYITYDYKSITETTSIENFTKQDLVNYLEDSGLMKIYVSIYLMILFYLLITYVLVTLFDVAILSMLAYLTSKLYSVNISYKGCFNIAIYALTLPILLNILYIFINTLTGFKIEYFQIMYNIVSYIYVLVAILLIKSDLDKKGMDLIKIEGEIKKQEVEEEPVEEKKEPKEDKDQKKKKDEGKENDNSTPEPGQA